MSNLLSVLKNQERALSLEKTEAQPVERPWPEFSRSLFDPSLPRFFLCRIGEFPNGSQSVPGSVRRRLAIGSKSVRNRFRIGSEIGSKSVVGSKSVPNRFQIGSESVPNRFRVGSESGTSEEPLWNPSRNPHCSCGTFGSPSIRAVQVPEALARPRGRATQWFGKSLCTGSRRSPACTMQCLHGSTSCLHNRTT